ncbi:MAG: hypothetical protein CME30_02700 [Gemmatimonadetes bacterium]|nr:hypothetical protein [Gemmatimonadota bacterium]
MFRNKKNLISQSPGWITLGILSVLLCFSVGDSKQSSKFLQATNLMTTAAQNYLNTLTDTDRQLGTWAVDSDERFDWHFIPRQRNGLPLKNMNPDQRSAAHTLLRNSLSSQGYMKATGVLQLEGILGAVEGRPERRDPEDYYLNIFGTPTNTKPWGWRFEGHHISLNFSVGSDNGSEKLEELSFITPAFFGSNPHLITEGVHSGQKLLGAEEELARELISLLKSNQLESAIFQSQAPEDIITGINRDANLETYQGIPISTLNETEQLPVFLRLLREYIYNAKPNVAEYQMKRIEEAGLENLYFGWAGSTVPGEGHYYRIHGPTILIEYDNVQNNANHVHSVWRDMQHDFGGSKQSDSDLLRKHYDEADHHQTNGENVNGKKKP